MKTITKTDFINYMVDVKGNSEEEARKILSIYGTSYLSAEEKKECIEFNS